MWMDVVEKCSLLILDKKDEIQISLACLLARGHLLIEDVPGVGKTTLVQALARLLDLQNSRIQFTSDLLPSDIIGNSIYDQDQKCFRFFQGPLFSNLVLADELNRANPRTQSSLLQAMEEGQVTVDRQTMMLPKPFFLIATQNPRSQTGTFSLPESQLDRFLMSIHLNYASPSSEIALFQNKDPRSELESLSPLINQSDLLKAQQEVDKVYLSELLAQYIFLILKISRDKANVYAPLSTRTGLGLARAARAWAYLEDRDYVIPEDVQKIAIQVIGHRLGGQEGVLYGKNKAQEIIKSVEIPT